MTRTRKVLTFLLFLLVILAGIMFYYYRFDRPKAVLSGLFKQEMILTGHTHIVWTCKFHPGGELIASGSVDGSVIIWNKGDGKQVQVLKHPEGVTFLDFSNDGNHIVTTSYDKKVRIWDWKNATLIREFVGHTRTPFAAAISPDGKILASGAEDATIKLWDVTSGTLQRTLTEHKRTVWSLAFHPDGTRLASASYDDHLKIWSIPEGILVKDIKAHSAAIVSVAYSHNGEMLASASDDKLIKLWNSEDGTLIKTLKGSDEHVQGVAFSPDDKLLISSGRDKNQVGEFVQTFFGTSENNRGVSMRLWDVRTGEILQTFSESMDDMNDVDFSPDGNFIVGAGTDGMVRLWKKNR